MIATGCADLDEALLGGLHPGLTLVVGRPKDGKSMVLASLAAEAWLAGKHVLFASLEMSEIHHKARVFANLTNTPMDDLFARRNAEAVARFDQLAARLGLMRVQVFPVETPVGTVLAWVERCVEVANRPVDLVLVDALDFLTSGVPGDKSELAEQKVVAQKFTAHARIGGYCMAATAPTPSPRAGAGQALFDVVDQVLQLQVDPNEKDVVSVDVRWHRNPDPFPVGPWIANRACGRMWPVSRPGAEW